MTSTQGFGSPLASGLMLHALAKNWWLVLLRGIAAIIFGVLTFIFPGVTLLTLVLLFGIYAIADGIFSLIAAFSGGTPAPRWWLAVVGVCGIAAGLVAIFSPAITALVLLFFIAGWAIAMGVMEIVGAIRLRKEIDNEWLLIANGVLSVLFGLIMFIWPGVGALAQLFVIGFYAVVSGVLLVMFALRLRKHTHAHAAKVE